MSFSSKLFVGLLLLFILLPLTAQDNAVTVPDVTGLSPAQAAAELNRVGLFLGTMDTNAPVPTDELNPDYSILAQSPNHGENVEAGSTVDVTLNYYNVLLRYDGNEFHLINVSGVDIGLHNLSFETANRRFEARQWGDMARTGFCVQAWTIEVNNFYEPQECGFVQGGIGVLKSIPENQRFWIDSRVESFRVMQNGMLRVECLIAQDSAEDVPEDTCAVWLASNQPPEDITEYLYFVYDAHHFYVHNRSANQWMPLESVMIEGLSRLLVENRFFDFEPRARLDFLAPQQCLHLSDGTPIAEDAEQIVACDVVIQSTYSSDDRFWLDGFTVTGILDIPASRQCPPVAGDMPSVCLIPR